MSPAGPEIKLFAIAACSRNRVIGRDNKLPWHIPEDLEFFRNKTRGHILIMGRKTFESLPKPLPHRFHIVITRQKDYRYDHPQVRVVHDLKSAVELARSLVPIYPPEVFITGGGEIYRQALPIVDRVYLTTIDQDVEGDAYFPELAPGQWRKTEERRVSGNPSYSFETWEPTR